MFKIKLYYLLIMSTLLLSCGGVAHESWTLVKLLTTGEQEEVTTQTVELRNCSVPEKKTLNCSAGTSKNLNVSLGGSISGMAGAVVAEGEISIDPSVSAGLGFDKSSGESLELQPPKNGFINRYEVTTEYRVLTGDVLARSSSGNERKVNYAFQASCSLTVEPLETIPCEGQEQSKVESNSVEQPEGAVESNLESETSASASASDTDPTESDEADTLNTSFDGRIAYFEHPYGRVLHIMGSQQNEIVVNLDMFSSGDYRSNIAWAPDGSKLAFALGMDLYVMASKGGTPKQIHTLRTSRVDDEDTFTNRGYIGNISWSPNSNQLMLTVVGGCGSDDSPDIYASGKLILINADGSNPEVLYEDDIRIAALDWSPNGKKVLFSVGQSRSGSIQCGDNYARLGVLDVKNKSQPSWLAEFRGWSQNSYNGGSFIDNASWSPDGQTILFDVIRHDGYEQYRDGKIYKITSDGSEVIELIEGVSPSWSPDGTKFVYRSTSGGPGAYDHFIEIADADGTHLTQITEGVSPSWGP